MSYFFGGEKKPDASTAAYEAALKRCQAAVQKSGVKYKQDPCPSKVKSAFERGDLPEPKKVGPVEAASPIGTATPGEIYTIPQWSFITQPLVRAKKDPRSASTSVVADALQLQPKVYGRCPDGYRWSGGQCVYIGKPRLTPIRGRRASTDKEKKRIKIKRKTVFPLGLVVSKKAQAKMAEHQIKIDEKLRAKEAKKAEQKARWGKRHDVQEKWKKWEQKQEEVKDRILAKWDAQDLKLGAERSERLARLASELEETQKEKNRQATEDVQIRIKRARYMARVEEKQLRAVKKREYAQVRRDKFYNFFGRFLGWEKRIIPTIPVATLAEWHFNGWEL